MTSIVLIPWAMTEWGEAGRYATRTPLPLTESGVEQAVQWANELAGRELRAVYCGDEPNSRQTGRLLADRAEVKLRPLGGLNEVDLGLWDGLTESQVDARFPKLYRRWVEDPLSVRPPDGESVGYAGERLGRAVDQITRKYKKGTVVIVLGPIALALVRRYLEDGRGGSLHGLRTDQPVWYHVENRTRTECH